ncbi:MAG TPA: molybdate ABC transporter substrate-binding protein [Vicinamibacteria bacterium]|nr:molybdate ABC transporter substrate-binding protein [Vicinamibacteria bacterium]
MLRFALLALVAAQTAGLSASPNPGPGLRIAAASDLRFALDEILTSFRAAHPSLRVDATYGSSGNFFAQLREGAPFDVFLSADSEYARRLSGEGFAEAPFPYAIGRLALVVRKESGLDPRGLGDLLKSPAIRRVAIANPAHAPYGRAADAALDTWRVRDLVAPKLVFGDSVSQAAQFVDAGAAQAGIVALALVKAKSGGLAFAEISESAHPPLDQAGVVLKRTRAPEAARAFQAFLTGDAGRAILSRHGFGLPKR